MLAFREQRPMLPAEIVPLLPGRLQGTNPREPQRKDMGNTCHKAVEMSKEHLRIKVWDFIWAFDNKKQVNMCLGPLLPQFGPVHHMSTSRTSWILGLCLRINSED